MNMFDRIGPFKKASLGTVAVNNTESPLSRVFNSVSWLSYIWPAALNVPEFTVAGSFYHATGWLAAGYTNCMGGALQPMRSFNPQGKPLMIEVDYTIDGQYEAMSCGLVVSFMEGEQVGAGWNTDNDISSTNMIGLPLLGGNSGTFQILLDSPTGSFPAADLDKSLIVAVWCHNTSETPLGGKYVKVKLSAKYCLVGTECLDLTK